MGDIWIPRQHWIDYRSDEVREEQAQGRGAHSKYCVAPPFTKEYQDGRTEQDWKSDCIEEAGVRITARTCPKCLKGKYSSEESLRCHYSQKKNECRTEVIASGRKHGGNLEHPKVKAAIKRLKDPYEANERARYYQANYRDPDERKRRRIAKKEQKEADEERARIWHNFKRADEQVHQFLRKTQQERALELREHGRYLSAAEREADRKQTPAEREQIRQLMIFREEEQKRMDIEASIKAQCTQSSDSE